MRVLLVNGFDSGSPDADIGDLAASVLRDDGHHVDVVAVGGVPHFMSAEEHAAYETDDPLIDGPLRDQALLLQKAEALVFCYPTVLFTVPASLKAWLERVMVPGVAFVFNEDNKVRPGLTGVRRLAVVTTSPHDRRRIRQARDLGRRTILRTLRMNCRPLCRRTFVSVPGNLSSDDRHHLLNRRLVGW